MAAIKGTTQEEMKKLLIEVISSPSTRIDEFVMDNHLHTPSVRPGDVMFTNLSTGRRTLTIQLTDTEQEKEFQKQLDKYYAGNTD